MNKPIALEDFEQRTFPYAESSNIELKQSFNNIQLDKYVETICAFLNTVDYAALIFGVRDDLKMTGVSMSNKDIDMCLRTFDNIIHSKKIVNTTTNPPKTLMPTNITVKQYVNSSKQRFIVVEVRRVLNNTYELKTGVRCIRLNASNYKITTFNQFLDEHCIQAIKDKARVQQEQNVAMYSKEINVLQKKLNYVENDNALYKTYLENTLKQINRPSSIEKPNSLVQLVAYWFPCFSDGITDIEKSTTV